MLSRRRAVWLFLLVTATSCAGPAQLARLSEHELKAGQPERAFDYARRGVTKDPENERLRRAMTDAAAALIAARQTRVLNLAEIGDTLGAARGGLELRTFRASLEPYRLEVPPDSVFAVREAHIIESAAASEYRRGQQALDRKRPKEAFFHFQTAAGIVPGYLDVWKLMEVARAASMTRIAILPFVNQTDVPELSRTMADAIANEIAIRIGREEFGFTELVSPDEIYASMTVAESRSLTHEAGFRIAEGVEADRIVVGRFHSLRARSHSESFDHPIYHKVSWRDSSGHSHDRYVESRFVGMAHERTVWLSYEYQVLDARTRAVIASHTEPVQAGARVAWTDYRAEGNCRDYVLYPPEFAQSQPDLVKTVTGRWKQCFGDWELPTLLEESRKRSRAHYDSRYRDEFRPGHGARAVLLGELPDEDELATLALERSWDPLVRTLKEIDLVD